VIPGKRGDPAVSHAEPEIEHGHERVMRHKMAESRVVDKARRMRSVQCHHAQVCV